jgi:hypothetical protein
VRANAVLGSLHHEYFLAPTVAPLSICLFHRTRHRFERRTFYRRQDEADVGFKRSVYRSMIAQTGQTRQILDLRSGVPCGDDPYMPNRKKRKRQRIDTMIDAHIRMRREALPDGEWNGDGLYARPKTFLSALWSIPQNAATPAPHNYVVIPAKGNGSSSKT